MTVYAIEVNNDRPVPYFNEESEARIALQLLMRFRNETVKSIRLIAEEEANEEHYEILEYIRYL